MDELKRLVNSRKGYRIHLKKLLAKSADLIQRRYDKSAESEMPSLADLCDLRDQLKRKDELIFALDAKIIEHITDEEELVSDVCEAEDIKESISTGIAHITQIIATLSAEVTSISAPHDSVIPSTVATHSIVEPPSASVLSPPSTETDTPKVTPDPVSVVGHDFTRLPKLSIPTFAGDTLQWQSFWDCFEAAVHNNRVITGVQKLNYLRAQLQGSSLRVIAGLPLTNDNYNHSVALLKERFGDTDKLTAAHMQALVEMKSPSNTLTSLQLFYDSIECHIRSLQSLGSPEETYAPMLIPTILKKLPAEVRRNLARAHGTEKWTLTDLRKCILQELRILDMGAEYSTTPHSPTAAFTTVN